MENLSRKIAKTNIKDHSPWTNQQHKSVWNRWKNIEIIWLIGMQNH